MLHVAIIDFDIRLGEEAEYLCQCVAFAGRHIIMPIFDVIGQRHFFRQPMDLLLG
jgi:hypothetical protein